MTLVAQPHTTMDVTVTVLLVGGHQYTFTLKSDSLLLHSLVNAVVAHSQNQSDRLQGLFQIPMQEGRAALVFPVAHLVGLITEPPLLLQPLQAAAQSASAAVLPSRSVQIDQFLTQTEQAQLLAYVEKQAAAFVPTNTATGETDYRQSSVLYSFPQFSQLLSERIQSVLPRVFPQLGIQPFAISQIEAQLTAHNHGNYYKIHNDNGSPDAATRELTYVYYFYREPKAFSGGELRIYDSKIEQGLYVQANSFHTVQPRNNSIVFFLSRYMHEVLPVSCPSQSFMDSRFTMNGWIRR